MTLYVGIDQSYSGFGVVLYNSYTGSVEQCLGKFDADKYGKGIDRLQAIGDWLYNQLPSSVEHVCMECYASGAKFGREMAGELGAITKQVIWQALSSDAKYPTIVSPGSIKKYATGKGVAPKQQMLLAIYKRWGIEFKDDNLADAYVLARIAHAIAEDPSDLTVFQREVLKKLVPCTELRSTA